MDCGFLLCECAERGKAHTVKNRVNRHRLIFVLFQFLKLFPNIISCALLHCHGHAQRPVMVLAIDVVQI